MICKAARKIGTFAGQSSFTTWLYRITMNTAMDELTPVGSPAQRIDDRRYGARFTGSPRPGDGSAQYAYLKIPCKLPAAEASIASAMISIG